MKISFEAIGQQAVTFAAGSGAEAGKVCKVTDNGTVGGCASGDSFCGVVCHVGGGAAAVITAGFVELPYSGSAPAVGYGQLAADGNGGVSAGSGSAGSGREYLIVSVDTEAQTVGLFL